MGEFDADSFEDMDFSNWDIEEPSSSGSVEGNESGGDNVVVQTNVNASPISTDATIAISDGLNKVAKANYGIGQATVNLFEATTKLPNIIETNLMELKDIKHYIENYANYYADRDTIDTLVVLDIFPLNYKTYGKHDKYKSESIRYIKAFRKISKKLRCPIICVYFDNIDKIKKHIDKVVVVSDKKGYKRNINFRCI